jgi:hypothetical protein
MIGTPGQRVLIRHLLLDRISNYQKRLHHEQDIIVWRYAFRDARNHRVIYSGKILPGLTVGKRCDIRATIKGHDLEHNCTRIMRPVVVPEDVEGSLL